MNRNSDRVPLSDPSMPFVALGRLGELTARGASPAEVLQAVAGEAARLSGVGITTALRYQADGSTEIVASDGAPADATVGVRAPVRATTLLRGCGSQTVRWLGASRTTW